MRKFYIISFTFHLVISCLTVYFNSAKPGRDDLITVHLVVPEEMKEKQWIDFDFSPKSRKEEKPAKKGMLSWKNGKAHAEKAGKRPMPVPKPDTAKSARGKKTSQLKNRQKIVEKMRDEPSRAKHNERETPLKVKEFKGERAAGKPAASLFVQKEKQSVPVSARSVRTFEDRGGEVQDDEPISLDTREYKYMDYFSKIRNRVESVWIYPIEALDVGEHGDTVIQFHINRDGSLEKTSVYNSSGIRNLDDESIRAVVNAAPFPEIPEGIAKERLNIIATFSYNLGFVAQ